MPRSFRQRLAEILRPLRLLGLADFFLYLQLRWRFRGSNQRFLAANPQAPVPPPAILYDILGTCDLAGFHSGGRQHAAEISRIIAEQAPGRPLRILEWGCGPARVLPYLSAPDGSLWERHGSDYNPKTIAWCRQKLPQLTFHLNQLGPPIPVPDASFDVVYCISVFTHLSEERHHLWVAEMQRLLKPGGLFIGTFHGAYYRSQLSPAEQQGFDEGRLVVRAGVREGKKNYAAYHSDQFVQRLLSPFAKVWQTESQVFTQSLWCAVKTQN
jgi:ubiquinone/menaquinone biosynthesis C-methylase UbiE